MKDLFGNEMPNSIPMQKRGGGNSVYVINGCSNHCAEARADEDFYATPSEAVEMLLEMEDFGKEIWEPCAGMGHISKVLIDHGHDVKSTDLVNRGFTRGGGRFYANKGKGCSNGHCNEPSVLACKGVCGEGVGCRRRRQEGRNVLKAHFRGRNCEAGAVQDEPADKGVGGVEAVGVREERSVFWKQCGGVCVVGMAEGVQGEYHFGVV